MFIVGLTGGIATGKSTVTTMLRNMGIEVIDSDIIAREVVQPGKRAWKRIRKEFSEQVLHEDGTLNREKLGDIVFSNPDKRRLLNSITHPEIYKSITWKCIKFFFCGHQFVVVDLPLLYESGQFLKYVHKTIVVTCDATQQLNRLMARNQISEADALRRINAQMPLEKKVKMADYVINNAENLEDTSQQVKKVVKQLKSLNTHWKYRAAVVGCLAATITILGVGPYLLYMHFK